MKKRLKRLLLIIVSIVLIFILFMRFYKPFGAPTCKKDWENYSKRSVIFKDGKFSYSEDYTIMCNWNDPYKDRKTGKGITPKDTIPFEQYKYTEPENDETLITWLGHSSILIQMHGLNILIDPVFEKKASPFSFITPDRIADAPLDVDDLPEIDLLLLTHDHYDHESYETLTKLDNKVKKYIVPLGMEKDLKKFGINIEKVTNMAWWEELNANGLTIACTPSKHYSLRYLLDKNDTLWCSYVLKDENVTIFDSSDTGYGEHFKEIYEKYGEIDFGLFDGAQYNERWHSIHMFPEESVQAAIDIHSKVSMLQHHCAFILSDHSWDEPIDRFVRRAKEEKIEYVTPILGQTFNLNDYKAYQNEWWKEIQ